MRIKKISFHFCFVICLFFLNESNLIAQHFKTNIGNDNSIFECVATKSELRTTPCSGVAVPEYNIPPLLTNIKNLEKKHVYSPEIEWLKSKKTESKLKNVAIRKKEDFNLIAKSSSFSLATNFQGNVFNGGAPPDNTIAIANNGNIVSVINCNIAYYNNSGSQLWTGSFWELFNDSALTEIIYDPIVLYDSQQDRFVMIAIHGFTSATSKVIISFSKSNNPLDGWWIYKLSGNPLNNSCWLDYPKLGISNNEIYITGNLFDDLTGFSQSVIYQITKSNGLAGTNLNWVLWSNIAGSPITIVPVSYGQQGNYGPGLYFVNQSPGSGNAVDLYEITNDISANPQLTRNTIFKGDYEPSGNAEQLGTAVQLITGDCRILNAFYLDGIIHYVFQADYQNSNYTGINYNQLNVNTLTNLSYTYGQLGFDCAYPSVASFATSSNDKSVMLCFLRSAATIFPETRAILFDDNQTWSNTILIKSGNNYVDAFQFDNTVRWGDYTGIAYKFNPTNPEVWLSGCYGSNQNLFSTNYNCFNTWIAQIHNPLLNTSEYITTTKSELKLFPNPIVNLFSIDFNIAHSSTVRIDIIDLSGKIVCPLFNGNLKKGQNLLTFNRAALSKGIYFLTIKEGTQMLCSEKIIIE